MSCHHCHAISSICTQDSHHDCRPRWTVTIVAAYCGHRGGGGDELEKEEKWKRRYGVRKNLNVLVTR